MNFGTHIILVFNKWPLWKYSKLSSPGEHDFFFKIFFFGFLNWGNQEKLHILSQAVVLYRWYVFKTEAYKQINQQVCCYDYCCMIWKIANQYKMHIKK